MPTTTLNNTTTINALTVLSKTLQFNRKVVSSTSYTIDNTTDLIIAVVGTTTSPITINLPSASSSPTQLFVIVDEGGNAQTNNITINANTDTIIGSSTFTINKNYNSVWVYSDGISKWFFI